MTAPVRTFVIRRAFLLPLGLLLLELLGLFIVCLVQQQPLAKVLILALLSLPIAGLFVGSLVRRLTLTEDALTARRLVGAKTIRFDQVTELETVAVRSRIYLTLSTEDDFLILSNSYGDFSRLVEELLVRIPPSAVSETTTQMAAAPPRKKSDVASAWIGVLLMLYILYAQF